MSALSVGSPALVQEGLSFRSVRGLRVAPGS